ncbi:MAG TPA: hypothetical protein VM260_19735 [Pirellula sp.]|nr:hypothetical protein [Pirellula sp.]
MKPTSGQLWERIQDAGLASPDECRNWAIEIAKAATPELLNDPSKLASELIRLGKITPYQANVLFSDLPVPIAIGPYRITESLESKLGANWFLAFDSNRPKKVSRWCYLLTPNALQAPELKKWPPSLKLAAKQIAVTHPSIDKWHYSGIEKSCIVGFCDSLDGQSLASLLTTRPLNWSESVAMVEQIASGLQKIHDSGLVHGSICLDAIWCVEEGEFVLRRDPFFPPVNPYSTSGNSVLARTAAAKLVVAAPELTLPNGQHSFQSDLYALGCVWYQSLTGSSPIGSELGGASQVWAKAHSIQRHQLLGSSKLAAPLEKCLNHLLAKNPSARFSSASVFVKAIEFAVKESEKQFASMPVAIQPCKTKQVAAFPTKKEPSKTKSDAAIASLAKQGTGIVADSRKQKTLVPRKSKGKQKSKKKTPVWLLPAMIGGSCLIFGLVIMLLIQNSGQPSSIAPDKHFTSSSPPTDSKAANIGLGKVGTGTNGQSSISAVSGTGGNTSTKPAENVTEYFSVEADDGQMLWAPPQAGLPYSLEMFPAGLEAMVIVSGNAWNHRGGLSGVGRWWVDSQPELAKMITGLPLLSDERINSVAIALYPSKTPGVPQAFFRISYTERIAIDTLVQSIPGYSLQLFDPKSPAKKGFWSNESRPSAIAIAMDEMQTEGPTMIKRAVVGPEELMITLPELNGGPAPLRRQLETLLKSTDSRADLSVLFAPSFIFGDGRELLWSVPRFQEVLRNSIDESMQAVAFTTTVGSRWYLEIRMLGSETRDAAKFTASLKSSLLGVPDSFEKVLSSGKTLHPYWRALGLRYPQMMRTLNRYGRFGFEDGQVVANAYLPTDAFSNIVVASWMALNSSSDEAVSAIAAKPKPPTHQSPKSIEAILEAKITVGFEQESLESALQLIASEVSESVLGGAPISMAINGTAFQKEGITRNQQLRAFKQNGVPLRTVLTDLVRHANPVTTVQSPTERDQKVVWLVLENAVRPGEKKIELTTRIWSETNKVQLPREFVLK